MKVYIFKNTRKVEEKHPDYTINVKLDKPEIGKDGKPYAFSKVGALWLKDNPKTGTKYMSGELEMERLQPKSLLSKEDVNSIKALREHEQKKIDAQKAITEHDFVF